MERQSIRRLRLPKYPCAERRACARFPLDLAVRYTDAGGRAPVEAGAGRTIDMSSSGLSFTADKLLPTGVKLDLAIDWPVELDGGVGLQLIVSGGVVRANGTAASLQIERHQFKTRSVGLKAPSGNPSLCGG